MMQVGVWFPVAFMGLFFAIGIGLTGYGLLSLKRSVEAESWPGCVGALKECKLETSGGEDGDTYGVAVRYEYAVNGREYEGKTLAFGYAQSNVRENHEKIYAKLSNASKVEVRYNPTNPEHSALSYGIHSSIKFVIAFGILWLGFTTGFCLLWWIGLSGDAVLLDNLRVLD